MAQYKTFTLDSIVKSKTVSLILRKEKEDIILNLGLVMKGINEWDTFKDYMGTIMEARKRDLAAGVYRSSIKQMVSGTDMEAEAKEKGYI